MNKTQSKHTANIAHKSGILITIMVTAYLVGTFLRLHLLREQVLLDDEWHSMAFVIDRPLSWLLTHFAIPNGFTSIPLNIHDWILLKTVGWSELWLRAPSIVLGLICLFFGPIIAKPIIGLRKSVILSLLIAISPILVFYSRLSRPYSAVACLGFFCLIYAARYIKSKKLCDGIGFAICGLLAVYWHLFAVIIVATIAASVLLTSIGNRISTHAPITSTPSWQQISLVLAGMSIAGAALMLPALLNSLNNSMSDVALQGTIHLSSWLRTASLFAGTANPVMEMLFWLLLIIGIADLWKKNKWLTSTIVACFPIQMAALLLVRPQSCHVGIVLTRYSIILLPASLLLVACGVQSILNKLSTLIRLTPLLSRTLIYAFVVALFIAGPLPRIMTKPNNFTNHGIFQHNYAQIDWSKSFSSEFAPAGIAALTEIRTDELSCFYRFLRENQSKRAIIEYPMMIGDHLNPYYFYQWYHQRPVIIGYSIGNSSPAPLKGGGVYGNTYIDEVLNIVDDFSQLHFYNLINMTDFPGMKTRNVEYIIFHKHFEAKFSQLALPYPDISILLQKYRSELYLVYEDANITVFSLEPGNEIMKNTAQDAENKLEI